MVRATRSDTNGQLTLYIDSVMRQVILLCFFTILAGCATERTMLVNSQGDLLTCETSGFGFFGAVSVGNQQQQCIADAEKRGYRVKN
jgi:hypothetical protein